MEIQKVQLTWDTRINKLISGQWIERQSRELTCFVKALQSFHHHHSLAAFL